MADLAAKIRIRAENRASPELEQVARGSKKLADRLQGARRELAGLDRRATAIRKFRDLKAGLGRVGSELERARARTARLGRQISRAEAPTRKLRKEFEASRRKTRALAESQRRQREGLHSLREQLRGAGVDTRRLGEAQRRVAADIERAARGMDRMGEAARRASKAQAGVARAEERAARGALISGGLERFGRGAIGIAAAPVRRVRERERSIGDLLPLGLDRSDAGMIATRGRDLSRRMAGVTEPVFVSASYDIKSGIESLDAAGVADMTEMAAITARATNADLSQMTSLFATAHGMFKETLHSGLRDREFGERFADQLSTAVARFKTDGGRMQQAIQSAGSQLANAGVSMEEQLAALGKLQVKMEAGEAGTTLAALARNAAKADEAFREAGIGIRTLDARGNIRPLADLLEQAGRELGHLGAAERGERIRQAFGDAEAVRFFDALWGQADALRSDAAALATGAGSARSMAAARDANLDSRLEMLDQRWIAVQTTLGESLLPALEAGIPALEALSSGIQRLVDWSPRLAGGIVGVVGVIGLAAAAAAPAITAVSSLAYAIALLRRRSAAKAAELAAGGTGGAGPPASARPGRRGLGERIRGAGAKMRGGGLAGLGRGAIEAGKRAGPRIMRGLKSRGGMIGVGVAGLSAAGTLLNDKLSTGGKAKAISTDMGIIAGAAAGAKAGAVLGTVVPGVGNLVGAVLGSIVGGVAGEKLGGAFGGVFDESGTESAAGQSRSPRSARELRGLPPRSPARAESATSGASLVGALAHARSESREAIARSGDRVVNITNRITLQQRPGESERDWIDRMLRELERRQALAGREALGDAY